VSPRKSFPFYLCTTSLFKFQNKATSSNTLILKVTKVRCGRMNNLSKVTWLLGRGAGAGANPGFSLLHDTVPIPHKDWDWLGHNTWAIVFPLEEGFI
jgi:hypothetical protein